MSDAAANPTKAGLEDVVVSPSEICFIDGLKGRLVYRGFDVDDLVAQSTFEEVTYLLWYGRLPTRKELAAHVKALSSTANRKLPPKLLAMLRLFPKKTTPMEILRTGISALSAFDPDAADNSREATLRKSIRLTAQMPTLVAAWDRIRSGKASLAPDPRLSLAGNFVYMMSGKKPTPLATKTVDVALILHADHEFNASTFATRVAVATLADLHAAIVAAIATLKGPRHGGANDDVLAMLLEIGDPARADAYVDQRLATRAGLSKQERGDPRRRIPGFGHRVYRVDDARARVLRGMAKAMAEATGESRLFETAERVYDAMKARTTLPVNVDFFSAVVYHALGIPADFCTSIFAVGRIAGWCAHALEQYADNRLIRPRAAYIGPAPRPVPVGA
jgi:citrate synthase